MQDVNSANLVRAVCVCVCVCVCVYTYIYVYIYIYKTSIIKCKIQT